MFITARQLEVLLRDRAAVVLPWGTRLTPAATDLARARKIEIRFDDLKAIEASKTNGLSSPIMPPKMPFLWWAAARTGAGKAALLVAGREVEIAEMTILDDATRVSAAVAELNRSLANQSAQGGILLVEHAGLACVLANRSPMLRAVVATSLAAIDAGVKEVAANVMVIEPGTLAFMQLRNMIVRFVRAVRLMDPTLSKLLADASMSGLTHSVVGIAAPSDAGRRP